METATAQADAIEDSTPQAVDDSASAQASDAADPVETTESETRAPSGSEAVDADKAAFERLQAGEKPNDVRQNPKSVDPLPKPSDSGQTAPAKSKANAGPNLADAYEGSDPKGIDALRRAQLLPPGDVWASMPPSTQKALMASAKNLLKQKGQISQQLGQATKTQDPADADGEEDATAQDTSGTAGHPPQGMTATETNRWQQQQRGVRAQTQPPARVEAQPGLDEVMKPLADFIGEDAAKPLREYLTRQQEQFAQQHKTTQAEYQQALQRQQLVIDNVARAHFMPQETKAFETLEGEAPGRVDANTRGLILQNAVLFYQASLNAPKPLDWQQSIELAGRSILQPDIKQQAQKALIDRRAQALRATPSKGNGTTRPDRALSIDDRDKSAWDMLSAKRDPHDVRAALS